MISSNFNKQIWAIVFLLFSGSALCQNYVELARLDFDISQPRPYEEGDGEGAFSELIFDFTVPLVINEKVTILTGGNIERLSVKEFQDADINFSALMLKLGLNVKHSDSWTGTYIFLPKISGDQIAIRANNQQYGGLVLLNKSRDDGSKLKFGLYSNAELSGPLFVPLLGYYRSWNRHELNVTLPLAFDYNYDLKDRLKVGIRFNGIVKSYLIDGSTQTYLAKANNEIAPYFQVAFGPIHWQLAGGIAIGRSFRHYNEGDQLDFAVSALKIGDERTQLNTDFEDGLFLKTGIIYRFELVD